MANQNISIAMPRRYQDERPSALSYWGSGIACLGFMLFIFWLAGLNL